MIMPLVRAHGKAIFAAYGGSVVLEPDAVEDTDVEKLLEIDLTKFIFRELDTSLLIY